MSILSWGKCAVQKAASSNGTPGATWTAIDTPKENTTKVTPTAGQEKTATEEGGGIVDAMNGKNTYVFEFDLFVKKGGTRPFEDVDGLVAGEHAFRVIPEDTECEGVQIDRCIVRVEESFSTDEGKLLHHVCRCLKPAQGKTVKPYTATTAGTGT